jgi:hypothetical protein
MPRFPSSRRVAAGWTFALTVAASAGVAQLGIVAAAGEPGVLAVRRVPASAAPMRLVEKPLPAAPAPAGLRKIDYWGAPGGFPRDAAAGSVTAVGEGLHPRRRLAVYDAPGGKPLAVLPRSISGLAVTVPIVQRRRGWAGVLLPSLNRRVGWVPTHGWESRPLRDQLIVHRRSHRLRWLRDGRPVHEWTVAVGSSRTPTPLGRTFVLGRTITHGHVYAGLDALVLGAIPEDRDALAPGLRGGHTAIHGWSRESAFGRSVSNGCVRIPPAAQRTLLRHIGAGTPVHIVD